MTLLSVKNFSESMWFCNSVIQTSSRFWNEKYKEFDSFGHFFLSMLQNFLGNVISLNNIYNSLEENMANNRTYEIHYDIARMTRIFTIFDPVELKDDDLVYNPVADDADTIPDPDINGLFAISERKQEPLVVTLVH